MLSVNKSSVGLDQRKAPWEPILDHITCLAPPGAQRMKGLAKIHIKITQPKPLSLMQITLLSYLGVAHSTP